MIQKGFVPIYLLIIIGLLAFVIIKSSSPTQQSIISPKPLPQKVENTKNQASASAQISQANLEKYLTVEAALLGISDNISLYFKDLASHTEVSINPTRSWIPASTIKAFVVLEAFRQRDLGLINFDQEVNISSSNVVPTELETDEFPRLREGTKATIYQLIEAMVIQSDNTAYNTLLDILDRRNIDLALRNIGITETVVGEKLNLDETQLQQDLQAAGRQPNTATAKDLATFFDLLYSKKIAHSEEILSIFKRQKINNMIPQLLPTNTVVAHKTGNWAPIYHDGGVIFKPNDPFILTVLTNSGDPKIVAEIAKIAYFQTADSVGQETTQVKTTSQLNNSTKSNQLITLDKLPNNPEVLAEETPEKFPTITASDLGITPKDLNPNAKQISDLRQALVIPGSILYDLKRFFEDKQLKNAASSSDLVAAHLNLAKSRLAEVKRLLGSGDLKEANNLLNESENHLAQATDLANKDPNRDLLLSEIKQTNDLHFAVLSDKGKSIPPSVKKQFIDSVYNFYQKNQKAVAPAIKSSVIANPTQQKPAIGEVTEIKRGEATLKFDDGSTKQVILTSDTQVRAFQEDTYQGVDSIKQGDKVAVIGLTNKQSKVIPQFILKDIPKELPDKHTGTVIEINPDENILKILDKKNQIEQINILDKTIIKSKDTNVSLNGIKAGSQVTVFGTTTQSVASTPIPSLAPIPTNAASSTQPPGVASSPTSGQAVTSPISSSKQPITSQSTNQITSNQPVMVIKATSVTVTKNSSGSQEKIEQKSEPKKEETKKAPEQPKQPEQKPPEPPKQEIKSSDKKK